MEFAYPTSPSSSQSRFAFKILNSQHRANRVNQTREQWAQIKLEDSEMEVVTKLAEHSEHRALPLVPKKVITLYNTNLLCQSTPSPTTLLGEFEEIESPQQFYKWFGSLEQGDSGENEAYR
jgi:hypothetical protein